MRSNVRDGLQVFRSAQDFLRANEVSPLIGPVTQHVEALAGVIARASVLADQQMEEGRGGGGGPAGG
jgi:hypothetical protein